MGEDNATRNDFSGAASTVVQAGVISGDVHVHVRELVGGVPRQLPPNVREFVGRREKLDELNAVLGSGEDRTSPRIALITGTAGVGKTALAVHWSHEVSSFFPDGILYADLHGYGPEDLEVGAEAVLASFLRALGVRGDDVPDDGAERAARYRTLLAERRVLVVLDNARSEAQVRPLIPASPSAAVVVTSRQTLTGLIVDLGVEVLHLDVLSPGDATSLLRTALGARADREPDAVTELIRHSAGLPLALRVLVGLVRSRGALPLADLVDALADERDRLDVFDTGGDVHTQVRAVFSWSYQHLTPDGARMFRLLGLFPGHGVDRFSAAALVGVAPQTAARLLAGLLRAHLVVEDGAGRFGMHDLLRAYAAELVGEHEPVVTQLAATDRVYDYYLHTADAADRLVTPARLRVPLDGTPRPGPRFAGRDEALRWLSEERDTIATLFVLPDRVFDARRWQLAYTMRGFYFLAKLWDDSVRAHEAALSATQRLGDLRAEATTRNNLGVALLERGRADEAEEHYVEASRLYEQVGDARGMSNALVNRAWIAYYRGDHEDALRDHLKALDSYRASGAELNAAITLRGVALVEGDLGRFEDAVAHLAEAMVVFRRLESDLDAAMGENCLGEVHLLAGRSDLALTAFGRAVELAARCGSSYEEARASAGTARASADPTARAAAFARALELYEALGAPEADRVREEAARA
ncbi:tetratricopeptide repeat protein [Actinosynnema sp. NPDC020468]|uniref:ATP-binding protein n=1 Tax=Actinosynnema sp. NPDC020468 TaxID=3154488 RepID=UPI0033F2384D